MHPAARPLAPFALLLLLTGLPAQGETEPAPVVVTQQERNELRAAAYRAENEGRFGDAADAFLKLSAAAPDRIDWVVAAGRCLGRSGRFGDAIDLLDHSRKRFPGAVEINAMLARTLLLQTERDPGMVHPEVLWAEAAGIAEEVLTRDPSHADSRLLLAQARYLLGQWDEAQRVADEAVRRHPDRPGAYVLVGRLATDRMRLLLQRLEKTGADDRERADLVARLHEQRRKARAAFEQAAALDPTRAHPHVALSQLASLDGKHDQAKRHLHDALAIDPETSVDHAALTEGMDWQARLDFYRDLRTRFLALSELPKVERARKAAALRFHEARALLDGLKFQQALQAFLAVKQSDPSAHNADYYAFLCAYHLQDYDAAERYAATFAARSAPGFADVLRALPTSQRVQIAAMVQFLGDRAYQAERIEHSRDLNHVVACLKDSADAWNNHAFLCRETGAFERAFTSYQYAIDREPDSPQLWNDGGVVLHYHLPTPENRAKAREMYGKAIELAAAVLASPKASAAQKASAEEARRNARLNLAELDKQ
ncbi:MAG: tetratricopeptide repeat protein [Planctomycetes bacterium]|nr:tetratricopeptide repeat protein [Planctomycetota bacterium]